MSADEYIKTILNREAVDTGLLSPVLAIQNTLRPLIGAWAGNMLLGVNPSGSFAKGTANRSGTDIDLFVSLSENTTQTLKEVYESLFYYLQAHKYTPKRQNVSINIRVGGIDVDLVPAKRHNAYSLDHSLYVCRRGSWQKTNVQAHIKYVSSAGRIAETRAIKLWRNQKGLDFPSFYLEMAVIAALNGQYPGSVSDNVWKVFQYLRDTFQNARFVDPANTNNVISDDLTVAEKSKIRSTAIAALAAKNWKEIIV